MTKDLKDDRDRKRDKKLQSPRIKPAAASIPNSFTKTSFEDALKKASRKIPESQSKDSDKTE